MIFSLEARGREAVATSPRLAPRFAALLLLHCAPLLALVHAVIHGVGLTSVPFAAVSLAVAWSPVVAGIVASGVVVPIVRPHVSTRHSVSVVIMEDEHPSLNVPFSNVDGNGKICFTPAAGVGGTRIVN